MLRNGRFLHRTISIELEARQARGSRRSEVAITDAESVDTETQLYAVLMRGHFVLNTAHLPADVEPPPAEWILLVRPTRRARRYRCTLSRGTYRLVVTATNAAGTTSRKQGTAKLRVL